MVVARSAMAVQAVQDAGLPSARHIQRGIDAWKKGAERFLGLFARDESARRLRNRFSFVADLSWRTARPVRPGRRDRTRLGLTFNDGLSAHGHG
jgi:hypothetical protein